MQARGESVPYATAAAQPVACPAIDRVYLARFTMGNLDLELEVLRLFAGQAPGYVDQLAAAQTEKAWKDAAHTLKGSAAAVGALQVAQLAEMAEHVDAFGADASACRARGQAVAALAEAVYTACRAIADLAA